MSQILKKHKPKGNQLKLLGNAKQREKPLVECHSAGIMAQASPFHIFLFLHIMSLAPRPAEVLGGRGECVAAEFVQAKLEERIAFSKLVKRQASNTPIELDSSLDVVPKRVRHGSEDGRPQTPGLFDELEFDLAGIWRNSSSQSPEIAAAQLDQPSDDGEDHWDPDAARWRRRLRRQIRRRCWPKKHHLVGDIKGSCKLGIR